MIRTLQVGPNIVIKLHTFDKFAYVYSLLYGSRLWVFFNLL